MATAFIDSNVFLRHLLGGHRDQSLRATGFPAQAASGRILPTTASRAIMEVVFVLDRTHAVPRAGIAAAVSGLVAMEHLEFDDKPAVLAALATFAGLDVPFVDALHVALARAAGVSRVVSFDRRFDRFAEIERGEP